MRKKSLLISLLVLGVLLAGGGALLYGLLNHEPDFYSHAEVSPGQERQQESREFEKKAVDLINEIQYVTDWQEEFTEQQVNSWLAEDFVQSNLAKQLPSEIKDPRVAFRPGKLLLAFRYGNDEYSTVVSVEAKVWVAKREPNVVVLEFEQLRAGALPLAPKVLQDQITEGARRNNIDVQWYRSEGNPTAVLRFQADRREAAIQLQDLEIRQGSIFLKGRSTDPELRGTAEATFMPAPGAN